MSRIQNLAFLSDFNLDNLQGTVVLNITYVPDDRAGDAFGVLSDVLASPYVTSAKIAVARAGESLGDLVVPAGCVGIGTICSITLSGIFLKAGMPVTPRFGGVVDIVDHKPVRVSSLIGYESSSVAPLEILLRSRMTDVLGAARHGTGRILGSIREIPEEGLGEALALSERMRQHGFHGVLVAGRPGEPLLGVPVTPGKAALVVPGGLNPAAALVEAGIPAQSTAMATIGQFSALQSVATFAGLFRGANLSLSAMVDHLEKSRGGSRSDYWSIFSEMKQITL